MKQISTFFTIFWCIYFPTGIAFNNSPIFSSTDELLTGILIIYTFMNYGKKRITNIYPWKEYKIFFSIIVFYIVYSLIFGANIAASVWYDLMQQIRPWSIIYCTWILNPQFSKKQKNTMIFTMVITLILFLIYNPETASNAFSETANKRSASFGQLAMCTSLTWYLLTKQCNRNLYISTAIAVIGLLSMKFKYYGQFGAWMFMLWYMKNKFDFKSGKIVFQLLLLLFIVVLLGWERFNAYYIEGAQRADIARPMMNKAAWQILWDYFPFGAGFGSFATAAAAVYYSPLWAKYGLNHMWGLANYGSIGFHCDSFFASLAEIGWVGIIFYIIFWKRRLNFFNKIEDMRYYKVAMMTLFCIFIEMWGDQSFFSGKGMGYMMLIGLCLNAETHFDGKRH